MTFWPHGPILIPTRQTKAPWSKTPLRDNGKLGVKVEPEHLPLSGVGLSEVISWNTLKAQTVCGYNKMLLRRFLSGRGADTSLCSTFGVNSKQLSGLYLLTYTGTYLVWLACDVSGMFVQTQHVCGAAGQAESPGLCKWVFSSRVVVAAGVAWVIGYRDQGVWGQLHPPSGPGCVCYTSWPTIL